MPNSCIHLLIAKKVNPDASIGFYVGSLAPDSFRGNDIRNYVGNHVPDSFRGDDSLTSDEGKAKAHLYDRFPDRKAALREFALNADNDYLKGILLHLFADKKFHAFWNENTTMPYQEGKDFSWDEYSKETNKVNSYAYHNTEWIPGLFKDMENWDYNSYAEVEFIKKDDVKWFIPWNHGRVSGSKLDTSTIFPPALLERLVNETAEDFNKWLSTGFLLEYLPAYYY